MGEEGTLYFKGAKNANCDRSVLGHCSLSKSQMYPTSDPAVVAPPSHIFWIQNRGSLCPLPPIIILPSISPPKHTQSTAHLLPPNALISKHSDNHPFCDNTGRLGCWLLLCCCRRSFGPQSGSAAMISFVRAPVSFCPPAKSLNLLFLGSGKFFWFLSFLLPCFALLSLFFEIGCLFLSPQHGLPPKAGPFGVRSVRRLHNQIFRVYVIDGFPSFSFFSYSHFLQRSVSAGGP